MHIEIFETSFSDIFKFLRILFRYSNNFISNNILYKIKKKDITHLARNIQNAHKLLITFILFLSQNNEIILKHNEIHSHIIFNE